MIRTRVMLVHNHFHQIAAKLHSGAGETVVTMANQVQHHAREFVPKRTWNLHNNIVVETYEGYTTAMVHTSGVPYGPRIEFGFVGPDALGRVYNQAPRPYMTPAAELVRPQFVAAFSRLEPMLA